MSVVNGSVRVPSCRLAPRHRVRDTGQAVVLCAALGVIAALVGVGVVEVGSAMLDRQRAHTAADAAALAGVSGGRTAAAEMAQRNHATLVQFSRTGSDVVVIVVVGAANAIARASDGP
jgi:Flp pilus assembly protein TadG